MNHVLINLPILDAITDQAEKLGSDVVAVRIEDMKHLLAFVRRQAEAKPVFGMAEFEELLKKSLKNPDTFFGMPHAR